MMPNENCLEGWKCPECRSDGPFQIAATCWVTMYDDGADDSHDFEYDDSNTAICVGCSLAGTVGVFMGREEVAA